MSPGHSTTALPGSPEEVLATIETRTSIVGTLPRYILCDELDYTDQRSAVDENSSDFFTGAPSLGFDGIPMHVVDYVAPFIKPNVIPQRGARAPDGFPVYDFLFLSDRCARVVAASKGDELLLNDMSDYGLDRQVAAVNMISTLFKNASAV